LLENFHRRGYHLDFSLLKALNRLRVNFPELVMDASRVQAAIVRERQEYDQLRAIRSWLESSALESPLVDLLVRAMSERLEQRLERIFRLVGLIYSPDDIYSVYYNCRIKPVLRPSAIEFLDNLLDAQLKQTIVPLLEEAFDAERAARPSQQVQFISHDAALEMLINGEDPWLRRIALELRIRLERTLKESYGT